MGIVCKIIFKIVGTIQIKVVTKTLEGNPPSPRPTATAQ